MALVRDSIDGSLNSLLAINWRIGKRTAWFSFRFSRLASAAGADSVFPRRWSKRKMRESPFLIRSLIAGISSHIFGRPSNEKLPTTDLGETSLGEVEVDAPLEAPLLWRHIALVLAMTKALKGPCFRAKIDLHMHVCAGHGSRMSEAWVKLFTCAIWHVNQ